MGEGYPDSKELEQLLDKFFEEFEEVDRRGGARSTSSKAALVSLYLGKYNEQLRKNGRKALKEIEFNGLIKDLRHERENRRGSVRNTRES